MAFGSIDLTTISRAQDYSGIKQNEDNKGMFAQTFISQNVQNNPDAKEKGNGEYFGDGGKRRRGAKPQERVIVKGRDSFDMKI